MSRTRAAVDRGFTLIELVIAVAIVATTVAAGFGISLASRSFAVSAAATEFDQFLDSARTIARELEGATLAFAPDAYGDGTEVRLLARDVNGAFTPTTVPTLHARASFEESESLGKAPFAFIVHANGSLSGRANYRPGATAGSSEVGCPASGAFHFVIRAAGASAERYVPCRVKLAASGPVALVAWPVAPIAASPTPCSTGPCAATSLPSPPVSTPTCPVNFTPIPGGCAPIPALNAGPRYHVTITGAPATMIVGATSSFTAQATLTNPTAVPPGTPTSIPVSIQSATNGICSATPPGWQPSGSSFTLNAVGAGTCTVTVGANPSSIAGALADSATASVSISVQANAVSTSSPLPCDLTANGRCYRRIIDMTEQRFKKSVLPDSSCDLRPGGPCLYIDSIRSIGLGQYTLRPPDAPVDPNHELLFRIDSINGADFACIPYSAFSMLSEANGLPLFESGVGGSAEPRLGSGMPSVYTTVNHVFISPADATFDERTASTAVIPTLYSMLNSLSRQIPGAPYTFTYYSSDATPNAAVVWFPDFPGCDNVGISGSPQVQYGNVTADLSFEIFQAFP